MNSIPAEKPVLLLPDLNLGTYVQQQTGRKNMKIWQGACIVHATFAARKLIWARAAHPNALVAAHPECPPNVLVHRDLKPDNIIVQRTSPAIPPADGRLTRQT